MLHDLLTGRLLVLREEREAVLGQAVVGHLLERLLGSVLGLVGLGGALLDARLGVIERLDGRLERVGQALPERFGGLAGLLREGHHLAGVVVDPDQPGGDHVPPALVLIQGGGDHETRLNVLGERRCQGRAQDGVLGVAVLGERVVHLRLLDDLVVASGDALQLLTHSGADPHRRRRVGRGEGERVGDHEAGIRVHRRGAARIARDALCLERRQERTPQHGGDDETKQGHSFTSTGYRPAGAGTHRAHADAPRGCDTRI